MESRVDLPHPDGPETETYSPTLMSTDTPSSARVSSPSARKTLLTLSSRISGSEGSDVSAVRLAGSRLRHQAMALPFVRLLRVETLAGSRWLTADSPWGYVAPDDAHD